MVSDELQKLLYICIRCLVQLLVIYVDHDLLKVILLLFPLKQLVRVLAIVFREEFIEHLNREMFEIVRLYQVNMVE